MSETIRLRRAVLNITVRCTLKCKLCVMGAPYFENPPHYEYDVIEKTIDKMFEVVDYIEWIEFSGGEPLIHKDLDKMIHKIMEYGDRFDKLLIMTNGTILPKGSLADAFIKYHDRMLVMLSHYGDLSTHAEEFIEFCEKNDVGLDVKRYYGEEQHFGGWVDYGDFEKRERTTEELETIYHNCGATKMQGCFTTHGGQMHWCVPSARGMKLTGKIPDNKDEYIDLFDETMTIEMQREKILEMQSRKWISACEYCVGDLGTTDPDKRFKAAEQV